MQNIELSKDRELIQGSIWLTRGGVEESVQSLFLVDKANGKVSVLRDAGAGYHWAPIDNLP